MSQGGVSPVIKAGRKYNQLYNNAEKLTQATHNLLETAYG